VSTAKPTNYRGTIVFAHDLVMAAASFLLSMFLRVGERVFDYDPMYLLQSTALFSAVAGVVFLSLRLYAGVWRYASLEDIAAIARAATVAILVFLPLMFLLTRLDGYPRSTLVINWFVLITLLAGPRFVYRVLRDRRLDAVLERSSPRRIPILLVGAGDAAELFIRATNRNATSAYRAVGLVDDKGKRVGRDIHGVRVLGAVADIPAVVERLTRQGKRPQRIVITKETVEGVEVRSLLDVADRLGMALSRLPVLTDFRAGVEDGVQIRPVAIEDLLGRPQTVLDRDGMERLIRGRRVLVTGAGGTIGSELVRQIAAFGPAHLGLLDSSEYHLYLIDLEVHEANPDLSRRAILADVRDRARIQRILAEEAPELVFHAAALKHVPMVELQPEEGVLTNVLGTRAVADACRASGVSAMVLISTDKAVNPTSVMGATKRIAESYCQALDVLGRQRDDSPTRFITVRFGNVLGSTGSVVPLFQRQLAAGGPLTVTHPDMKRFFMTVREAVELVLEATVLGSRDTDHGGSIHVLDMGEPVKIADLAKQMILLAGLRPDVDIKVVYTGPRPGEKLSEEILHNAESLVPTEYTGILLAQPRTADHALIARSIDELVAAAQAGNRLETLKVVQRLVPEYRAAWDEDTRATASG